MDVLLYPVAGFLVGVLVGMTGVGGGALMTPLLVPLFGVAPHTAVGNVDFGLLGLSLAGSIPGVWIGAHLSARTPEVILRNTIAAVLAVVGLKMLG